MSAWVSRMNLVKYPLLYIAWTKWKNGCSDDELVKWIRSLSREENIRVGEELVHAINEECQERHKINKHHKSLGIRSHTLPIFLGGLMEKCEFYENRSKQKHEGKRSTRSRANS